MSADKLRQLGWSPTIALPGGIASVYRWFVENSGGNDNVGPALCAQEDPLIEVGFSEIQGHFFGDFFG
jgi:hypothetical protein